MTKYKGQDLQIVRTDDGLPIAAAKTCDINVECDVIEVASPTSGMDKEFIPGRVTWSVSTNHLVSDQNWDEFFNNFIGETVTLSVKVKGNWTTPLGTAIVTGIKISASRGSMAQGTFAFKGTGHFGHPL